MDIQRRNRALINLQSFGRNYGIFLRNQKLSCFYGKLSIILLPQWIISSTENARLVLHARYANLVWKQSSIYFLNVNRLAQSGLVPP